MNINYNLISKYIIILLCILLFSFTLNTALYMYLPKDKPSFVQNDIQELEYKRYEIQSAFKIKKIISKKIEKKQTNKVEYKFLLNMTLNAIYDMGDDVGFIIVQEKGKAKTIILSINENFKGYKLDKIYAKYVIFTKFNKEFKLSILQNEKKVKYEEVVVKQREELKSIELVDDKYKVKRTLIENYSKNFDKIWKDINIKEIRTKKGIDGFKIYGVRKNSIFASLGLQKGDIIKSVNNVKLKSYNDAFKIYKKINKLKILNLIIIRNNQEEELIYEIK